MGILILTKRFDFYIEKILPYETIFKANSIKKALLHIVKTVLKMFSVGLSAWLFILPFLLYYFYNITPLSALWTVIIFPFIALLLIGGFLKIIIAGVLPAAAGVLDFCINSIADITIAITDKMAAVEYSEILIGSVPAGFVVFYYAVILFILFVKTKKRLLKNTVSFVLVLSVIAILGFIKHTKSHLDGITLNAISVGHGQAILLTLPNQKRLLFDAGSASFSDIGDKVINPFLRYSGTNKVDYIFISHPHFDHLNGIPEIARNGQSQKIYTSSAALNKFKDNLTMRYLKECLADYNIEISAFPAEYNSGSDVAIKQIWPTRQNLEQNIRTNDTSQVILIEYGNAKILLCGDIEKYSQEQISNLFPDIKADIVIAPHHGSGRNNLDTFLPAIRPKIIIVSSRQKPSNKQLDQLAASSVKVYYTCTDGAVSIKIDTTGKLASSAFLKAQK